MEFDCNSDRNRVGKSPVSVHGIIILLTVFFFLGGPRGLIASSTDSNAAGSDSNRFDFHADRMRADKVEGSVEYIGNAVFPLGNGVLKADTIKALFKQNADGGLPLNEGSTGNIEDSIKKIVAKGNVNIVFEGFNATGDEAVYETVVGSFVLTGDPATIQSSADTVSSAEITAERIVFNRAEASSEFIDNVTLIQGETVITADYVKAFFKQNADGELSLDDGSTENIGDSVEKMIANGNIKIISEDAVATGDNAIYDSAEESFVLTGDPATLVVGVFKSSAPEVEIIGKL